MLRPWKEGIGLIISRPNNANPSLLPFSILFAAFQAGAEHIQPISIVFEILRPGNGGFGVQQVLCQCGEGPGFIAEPHVLVIDDFA